MNIENEIDEIGFELSITGAFSLIVIYYFIIGSIVQIPFIIISELASAYLKTHLISQATLIVLREVISSIIFMKLIINKIRKDCGFNFKIKYIRKFDFKLILATLCLILGYFLWYQSSIGIVVGRMFIPKFLEEAFEEVFINPYSSIILITIIPPIFEEILMRGIILEGFLTKYQPKTAIAASALIFGLIHLNIPQFINATFIGLILGVIYYKTRSLILTIAGHMFNNIIVTLLDVIDFSTSTVSFFIGIAIFLVAGVFFIKYIERLTEVKQKGKVESI